jgi:uncharacterized cupredoxin-like copper-binding protein
MKKTALLIGSALLSIVLLAGCTKSSNTSNTATPQTTPATSETATPPTPAASQTGPSVAITLNEYSIVPDITLNANEPTVLRVSNNGRLLHNYVVPDLDIDVSVGPGETESVTINAPQAGTFDVTCTIAGHKELGMEGKVIVK